MKISSEIRNNVHDKAAYKSVSKDPILSITHGTYERDMRSMCV